MLSQGVDIGVLKAQTPTIGKDELDRITTHLELHIEQGNFLEVKGIDLGVVNGIRGAKRYIIRGRLIARAQRQWKWSIGRMRIWCWDIFLFA
jgi:hypothetical protein